MPVVWTPRHRGHAPNGGYWLGVREVGDEEPVRGDTLHEQLRDAGATIVDAPDLGPRSDHGRPRPDFVDFMSRAYPAWVAEGHLDDPGQPQVVPYLFATAGYAARYVAGWRPATIRAEVGLYAMDTMSLISEGTFDAACSAVHAAVHASDLVLEGGASAYAAVRPPGHHAGPAFYGGSCYFNNAAAAAQRLRDGGVARVAIIDIDAHQGNGTQEIFWERGDVLYASVHVDPAAGWFPHLVGHAHERRWRRRSRARPSTSRSRRDRETNRGSPRSADCATPARQYGPDAVVVSLGVDAAVDDPAAPLMVTAAGFAAAGNALAALDVPTVFVQEGGYDLPRLGPLVLAVLEGFEDTA